MHDAGKGHVDGGCEEGGGDDEEDALDNVERDAGCVVVCCCAGCEAYYFAWLRSEVRIEKEFGFGFRVDGEGQLQMQPTAKYMQNQLRSL